MIEKEILKSFTNKKCLVTGGTGLIGRQVVDILCEAGARVVSVSLDKIRPNDKATYLSSDLTSFDASKVITRGIDYVFHLAGVKGSVEVTLTKPANFLVPPLMMNTNVLEACRINKVKRVVLTSSIGAYPINKENLVEEYDYGSPPMDTYSAWTKRMAELQTLAYKTQYGLDNFAVVRPCNVFGPGDRFDPDSAMVIPSLIAKIARGDNPVVIWGDGSNIRDFVFSRDAAEGIILALYYGTYSSERRTNYVNLATGKGYSIKELVEALHGFINFNYQFDTGIPSGYPRRVMDISLARKLIHYNPTISLLDGLKETWNWFLEHKGEYLKIKNYFKED